MPDTVLNALKNKLARYQASGEADRVKHVKARIAELEKGEKKEVAPLAMTLTPPAPAAPAVLGATVSKQPVSTSTPAVKKAAAKKPARKKN